MQKVLMYEDLWIKKKKKTQKDSGKAHETYRGEIRAAKAELISCACGKECSKKLWNRTYLESFMC